MSERIEGLPVGVKIVAIRTPQVGETYIDYGNVLRVATPSSAYAVPRVIVVPDNDYKLCDISEVKIPDGYERDGDTPQEYYRPVKVGDDFLTAQGIVIGASDISYPTVKRIILRPVKRTLVVTVCVPHTTTSSSAIKVEVNGALCPIISTEIK